MSRHAVNEFLRVSVLLPMAILIEGCRTSQNDASTLNDRRDRDQLEDCSQFRAAGRRRRCEEQNQEILDRQQHATLAADAFIVVMGGWKSCQGMGARRNPDGMFLDAQFQMLKSNLENAGNTVRFIKTCFGLGTPIQGTVTYVTSENITDTVPTRNMTPVLRELWGQKSKLYVIGHSYGGWLALKFATELNARIE